MLLSEMQILEQAHRKKAQKTLKTKMEKIPHPKRLQDNREMNRVKMSHYSQVILQKGHQFCLDPIPSTLQENQMERIKMQAILYLKVAQLKTKHHSIQEGRTTGAVKETINKRAGI